jgi:hypothetical protein
VQRASAGVNRNSFRSIALKEANFNTPQIEFTAGLRL